jgi:AraC-like DNA-binding protein
MGRNNDNFWAYYRRLPESLRSENLPLKLIRSGAVAGEKGTFERKAYPFEVWEEITEGAGFVTVNKVTFSVKAGDIYRLPAGADHLLEPERNNVWEKKYFLLSGSLVPLLISQFGFGEQYHFPGAARLARGIFDILTDGANSNLPDIHLIAAEQFMKLLWRLRYDEEPSPANGFSPRIQQAIRAIDRCFETHLDLDEVAASLKISRSFLQSSFKKECGITPYEYHLRRKFEKAKELLLQSSFSIEEISKQLAFHDRFHFSREFTRRFGVPPAAFRKEK